MVHAFSRRAGTVTTFPQTRPGNTRHIGTVTTSMNRLDSHRHRLRREPCATSASSAAADSWSGDCNPSRGEDERVMAYETRAYDRPKLQSLQG